MSKPAIYPEKTAAGIAVDPRTLERVIPESRRPDGSFRKEIKIRPGFTPQEDIKSFRTKRQVAIESAALPKGHIIGWAPPPSSPANNVSATPLTKSAKKNAKRKKKRDEVRANWDDDDDDDVGDGAGGGSESASTVPAGNTTGKLCAGKNAEKGEEATDKAKDELSRELEKLEVR